MIQQHEALYSVLKAKSLGDFRLNLRAQVRGYWTGTFTRNDFIIGFQNAIDRGFNQAFRQGAAECGVKPSAYTPEMEAALQGRVNEQFPSVINLADSIVTKENAGKLGDAFGKIEIWIARYGDVIEFAKGFACNDLRRWALGVAEHCSSCLKLDGIVKPMSFWRSEGVLPRQAGASYLDCNGYHCKCSLVKSDGPVTEGPLPSLP